MVKVFLWLSTTASTGRKWELPTNNERQPTWEGQWRTLLNFHHLNNRTGLWVAAAWYAIQRIRWRALQPMNGRFCRGSRHTHTRNVMHGNGNMESGRKLHSPAFRSIKCFVSSPQICGVEFIRCMRRDRVLGHCFDPKWTSTSGCDSTACRMKFPMHCFSSCCYSKFPCSRKKCNYTSLTIHCWMHNKKWIHPTRGLELVFPLAFGLWEKQFSYSF